MSDASELSPREQQVALLIREGYTDKQIAAQLGMAERTVRVYIARIKRKLDLDATRSTRVQIAQRMTA